MKAGPYPSHGGFRLSGPIHITGTARRRSGGGRDNRAVFEIQEQSDGHLFGLSGPRQPQTVRGAARHPAHPTCQAGRCSGRRGEAVPDTGTRINFGAPAVLRKWPSLNKERISSASPYSVAEGTLDECMRQFTSKPISQQHLYEIHTAPQGELVTAVLSAKQIIELARLRDFL